MDNKDEEEKWFKNINKSDTGTIVDIIPSEDVRLRASSSNPSHTVRNLTDNNPSTKWVSNYNIGTYKDDFYTNRKITKGDYSRGQIVNDGKNRKLLYDNQKQKEILQNKIISLKNELNKQVEMYNNNKKRIKMVEPKTQKDFKKKIKYKYKERYRYWWYWRTRTRIGTKWVNDTAKYNQYLKANDTKIRELKNIGNNIYRVKNSFKIEDAKLKAQLNDIPSIDVNSLPVKVTNDGKYIGNTKTILSNNSTINGEWVEVEIPNTVVVKEYELLPGKRDGTTEFTPFPKDFYIVASNDTNKWEILDSHFDYNPVYNTNNSPIVFNIDNKKKYKYIRLVITALNGAQTGFHGLGATSLSVFNINGHRCYTLNKSCETFQSYSNKNNNMSKIEGLTMMEANINVLADLKEFNEKYQKYVKCTDITLPDTVKLNCTTEDRNIQTVNDIYDKLMDNGSIQKLQEAPLNKYIKSAEYEENHKKILGTHNEIIPLRKELDSKMNKLMNDEDNINADYREKYDKTMYYSLVLSVVLTSSLFFIFKKL